MGEPLGSIESNGRLGAEAALQQNYYQASGHHKKKRRHKDAAQQALVTLKRVGGDDPPPPGRGRAVGVADQAQGPWVPSRLSAYAISCPGALMLRNMARSRGLTSANMRALHCCS